jgi:uncharacterized LabA/DUF88 family protein
MEKLNAYIFIDASNQHYYLRMAGWQIDWVKFKSYCEQKYQSPSFFYYEGVPSKGQYLDIHTDHGIAEFSEAKRKKHRYFKFLKEISFKVRHKPVGRIYDSTTGRFKHKCNFDVELTIDALHNIDDYDCFVLLSGDGDFVRLVKYLKGRQKKTVIVAPSERLSWNLERAANQIIYLDDLEDQLKLQKGKPC